MDWKILKTTDGGTNWLPQTSGTTNQLYSVSITDSENITVVGREATILRTTNGGTSWSSQSFINTAPLNDISVKI
ncbi:MAG: YCF48-related protein [Ignavibacteriaceae bacterium]|nr:YCF48-related protein [Ignavibacteriaceae bacterium]